MRLVSTLATKEQSAMTKREFLRGIKTWKGQELRLAVAGNANPTAYRDFTLATMVNAQTMFVKSALMAARHGRPLPNVPV